MTGKLTNQVKSKTIDRFVGMNKPAELVDLASLPLTQAPRDKEDVELRVLLMSSVGNAGLNLHSARALIFMVRFASLCLKESKGIKGCCVV